MRDPMSWAIPIFRAFGVLVKVHVLFIIVTLGLFLRQVTAKDNPIGWFDVFLLTVLILFVVIVLHEFGHCFAARSVGGDAKEVLIWPLGGLAYVEVPNTPRANFIAAAGGPAVNVLICVLVAIPLAVKGFAPSLNPLANPFVSEMHNYGDGRDYTSPYGLKLYKSGTNEPMPGVQERIDKQMKEGGGLRDSRAFSPQQAAQIAENAAQNGYERAIAESWVVWLNRIFWLSWVLFLFNLIPAYPLDGGQMLQAVIWARTDYRRGVVVASYSGYVVAIIFLLLSITTNESLLMGLSIFMFYSAWLKLYSLEMEDGPFGYDFSAGYTSLERDDEPPPKPKQPGYFARWWQARKARKLQREVEQRAKDEERMDQLLVKIAQSGKNSLTDEERRFLERVSARYRNRS